MKYVDVILPLPLNSLFTYSIPEILEPSVVSGTRVLVPLGRSKKYIAIAVSIHENRPAFKVRPILEVLDKAPVLYEQQYKMWQWISSYYMSALGDIYVAALPAGLKSMDKYKPKTETYIGLMQSYQQEESLHVALHTLQRAPKQQKAFIEYLALSHWDTLEGSSPRLAIQQIARDELMNSVPCTLATVKALIARGMLRQYEREVGRLNHDVRAISGAVKPLSAVQEEAYQSILLQFQEKNVVLLHGVTSSGKTEVYIHLIQKAITEHKQVLYLLPEIALTVQIMERLQKVFGDRLGIYHSKYSDSERVEIWKKQLSSHPYDVILGARSAVFLPFQRLGLVVVDEEHETSFKQQDPAPRYHARSVAIVLARLYDAKVLLGTATPSMESYYNAQTGKYGLVSLNSRYQGIQLPQIQVVDVKDLRRRKMMNGPFSSQLLAAVRKALQKNQQVILFQNRRGYAPIIECKECGWVPKCTNCDVSLTYHKNLNLLTCHYCGAAFTVPTTCPNCGSTDLKGMGYGTEKIEDYIREEFPEARIARMDLDTTRTRNAYERLIDDFSAGRTNLLIGTQMISKGLDFDKVSVVGILDADSMLNYPDFRAYEHAFMMMSQVSGRAGRKGKQGLVILQTKNPDLPVIHEIVNHDYSTFFQNLLSERNMFHYPPYYHLIYIFLKHKNDDVVQGAGMQFGEQLRQWFGDRVLGPDKPAIARIKTMNIRKIVLKLEKGINQKKVREYLLFAQKQMSKDPRYGALQIYFDVDPL
jgi:primosomal protein N' (replication factor Y)